MRGLLLLPLVALALAGDPGSGVDGTARRGPTAPVCRVGVPCTAPAAGARLAFSRGGAVAATVVVGRAGRFRVALRPGRYAVRALRSRAVGGRVTPPTVLVPRGRYVRVALLIDTGIR